MQNKKQQKNKIEEKIRTKIKGTTTRPRLSVFRSNKFIYAQIIDDLKGKTFAQANDVQMGKGTKSARAKRRVA